MGVHIDGRRSTAAPLGARVVALLLVSCVVSSTASATLVTNASIARCLGSVNASAVRALAFGETRCRSIESLLDWTTPPQVGCASSIPADVARRFAAKRVEPFNASWGSDPFDACGVACATAVGDDDFYAVLSVDINPLRRQCHCVPVNETVAAKDTTATTCCDVVASNFSASATFVQRRCASMAAPCGAGCVPLSFDGATCCRAVSRNGDDAAAVAAKAMLYVALGLLAVVLLELIVYQLWRSCRRRQQRQAEEERDTYDDDDGLTGAPVEMPAVRGGRLRDSDEAASLSSALMLGVRNDATCAVAVRQASGTEESAPDAPEHAYCSICLAQFAPGGMTSVLPCTHRFHHDCLRGYMTHKLRRYEEILCPVCRQNLLQEPEPKPGNSPRLTLPSYQR